MKKYHVIGLIISMILVVTGFAGYMSNFFLAMSGKNESELMIFIFWLFGAIGMVLSIIFIILALVSIFSKGPSIPTANNQPILPVSGQITFSIINIFLGGCLFSTIFALYALTNAVEAKKETSYSGAVHRLKTAKSLNIVAIILAGVQDITIMIVMLFAFAKFFDFI
jgi:hypothetical protein